MPTTITPAAADPSGQTYTAPADGDAITAASVNGAFQKLADFIAWLRANPVTRGNLPAVGQQVSASSGAFSLTGVAAWTDVTNLTVTLTTTGRPVVLMLVPDGTADYSFFGTDASCTGYVQFLRGAAQIYAGRMMGGGVQVPASLNYLDVVAAGTYTYKLQIQAIGGTFSASYCKLLAYEL